MFKNIFSFEGRIRRLEFGISYICYIVVYLTFLYITDGNRNFAIAWLLFLPVVWIQLAQAAKRCHDLNKSGWWQIIPFYFFWLLFEDGNRWTNEYGHDPKNPAEQILPRSGKYSAEDYK